jgi:hypothetical protein
MLTEAVLDAAVMLSLVVPCCILAAFRNFSDTEEWVILPIKTVVGDVDLRRYFVIVYGQGSAASNIEGFINAESCQDKYAGSCIFPPNKIIDSINRTARGRS